MDTITNYSKDDFIRTDKPEPHRARRREILAKHPEVKKLFGPDIRLMYVTIFLVALQIAVSFFANKILELPFGWALYIVSAYIIGATCTQALFLAIHELTHNLAFKKQTPNTFLAFVANIPIVFPYAMGFKIYHTLHHRNQGVEGLDTDIPTLLEIKIFKGFFGKVIWLFNQIFFYAFRPLAIHPIKIRKWQIYNIVFQVVAMAIIIPLIGISGLGYLLLSIFFAGSLHPCSGHFISEHYVFKDSQETYSYYGPLNKLTLNAGYHNEHHDFPSISGFRLPQLKKIAPEYYDTLFYHTSWVNVIYEFLTRGDINLTSRVTRKATLQKD